MTTDTFLRGLFAFVFAATLGGAIYYKSSRETEELEENQKRYGVVVYDMEYEFDVQLP